MNRQEYAKKALPLLQAIADGKEVQYRLLDRHGYPQPSVPWKTTDSTSFLFKDCEYRVKPEPKSLWMIRNVHTKELGTEVYHARPVLSSAVKETVEDVEFREVLPE